MFYNSDGELSRSNIKSYLYSGHDTSKLTCTHVMQCYVRIHCTCIIHMQFVIIPVCVYTVYNVMYVYMYIVYICTHAICKIVSVNQLHLKLLLLCVVCVCVSVLSVSI